MEFERILVPMDFSPGSLVAFDAALEHFPSARVYLLTVLDIEVNDSIFGQPVDLGRENRQQVKAYDKLVSLVKSVPIQKLKVETMVTFGQPVHEILDAAKVNEIDLILMGSHGSHNMAKDIFGHCAYQVSRKADCSTWIIKARHLAKEEEDITKKVANR